MNGKQLKNSILQWAIQGKLVPQDPNDEPASILLERIRAEKARLVKEGRIKKDKNESIIFRGEDNSHYEKFADGRIVCIDDEIPFEVPQGWEWARLRSLVYNHGQSVPSQPFSYIDIGSINNIDLCLNEIENIIQAKDAPSRARRIVEMGDILYSTVRPYLHNMCIVDRIFSAIPIASTGFAVMACYPGVVNSYLFLYLQSPQFDQYANDGDNAKGVAYPAINDEKLYKALIPVPPKNEQNRIVEFISTIQPSLNRYNSSQRKIDDLNRDIKPMLRKSILQEAIQGKLVPQEPKEKPATFLLEQIREEKQKLLREGLLKKKDIVDSVIFKGEDNKYYEKVGGKTLDISEEIPFDIPDTWCWARIKTLYQTTSGGTPEKGHPEYYGGGIPWVKVGDLTSLYLYRASETISKLGLENSSAKVFPIGTILVAMYCNDAIGKSTILASPMATNQAICGLFPNELLYKEYVYYAIQSNKGRLQERAAGGAQKNINQKIVNELLLPIPPLAEQKRIVQRINDLNAHL